VASLLPVSLGELNLGDALSPRGGLFTHLTVRALASGSQVSFRFVLRVPEIWESRASGVQNPHTCDGGCSLVAEDSKTLASGCLWPFEVPGAPVAQGPGNVCVNICGRGYRRARGTLRAWNAACFFSGA